MNTHIKLILTFISLLSANVSAVEWQLNDKDSQLSFISTKKIHISETHRFNKLRGNFDEDGHLTVNIDLASVDTKIAVRDERMKLFLFDTEHFSTATIKASIDLEAIDAIAQGSSALMNVEANLNLHGQTVPLAMDVVVTRLVGAKLSVASVRPIILNAGDFALIEGIEKLRELAMLPSISHAVPVSFYLTFDLKK